MKRTLLVLIVAIVAACSNTTENEIIQDQLLIQSKADVDSNLPSYPGGYLAYKKYMADQLVYPASTEQKNIEGQVIVKFTIDKNGSTSNIKVLKGIDEACDQEVVRVLQNINNWEPALNNGQATEVEMVQRIIFRKNGDSGPASKPTRINQS